MPHCSLQDLVLLVSTVQPTAIFKIPKQQNALRSGFNNSQIAPEFETHLRGTYCLTAYAILSDFCASQCQLNQDLQIE